MGRQTQVKLIREFNRWLDPATKMIQVQPKVLAEYVDSLLDASQALYKPFAVNEQGQCFTWNPTTETWQPTQLKDIYHEVRRDPAV